MTVTFTLTQTKKVWKHHVNAGACMRRRTNFYAEKEESIINFFLLFLCLPSTFDCIFCWRILMVIVVAVAVWIHFYLQNDDLIISLLRSQHSISSVYCFDRYDMRCKDKEKDSIELNAKISLEIKQTKNIIHLFTSISKDTLNIQIY